MTDTPSTTSGTAHDPDGAPEDIPPAEVPPENVSPADGPPELEAAAPASPDGTPADAPTTDVPAPEVTAPDPVSGAALADAPTTDVPPAALPGAGETAPGAVLGRTHLAALLDAHQDPNARDHVALALHGVAGLTDRGLRRRRNEDSFALGRLTTTAGELVVATVCDGVASARRGDEASLAAAQAAVDAVLAALAPDEPTEPLPAPSATELEALAGVAAEAAATAAADLGRDAPGGDTPSCTYVGAVALRSDAVVAWVGDSRIYWLATDGSSRLLSVDDSWAEEIAAAGLMPREQAFGDRRAHVLTRWLGFDSPPGPARSRRVRVASPGMLMLCSDGIWNHMPDAEVLAGLVRDLDPPAAAAALVRAALADGGHDNATAALVPLVPDDDPDTDGIRVDGRYPEARTGPIPLQDEGWS